MSCDSDYIRSCSMKFKSESGIRSTVHTDFTHRSYKYQGNWQYHGRFVTEKVAIPCKDRCEFKPLHHSQSKDMVDTLDVRWADIFIEYNSQFPVVALHCAF